MCKTVTLWLYKELFVSSALHHCLVLLPSTYNKNLIYFDLDTFRYFSSKRVAFVNKSDRGSLPELFSKKIGPENFAKFAGKHLCQSVFLKKVIKRETQGQVFSCEFYETLKKTFFYRTPPGDCFCLYHSFSITALFCFVFLFVSQSCIIVYTSFWICHAWSIITVYYLDVCIFIISEAAVQMCS